jgi:hypothetical protein
MGFRLTVWVAALVLGVCSAFAEESNWDRVQTYGMLPLDPEEAATKGWTVNGLWAGYGMPEAIRSVTHLLAGDNYPVRWSYPTATAYAEACHRAGVLVPATIFGIGDHRLLRERFPQIERSACRLANGTRAYYEAGTRLFMCSNNPVYNEILVTCGKEAIDAGADLIVFDEIQGNELTLYWPNSTGYCDQCLKAYRDYLRSNYSAREMKEKFHIDDLESFNFAKRLGSGPDPGSHWDHQDALFKELWTLQKRLNFERAKKVVGELRAHMKQVGREIPICANTTEMGLEGSAGVRLSAVQWGQVVDFAAYERQREHLLPRGKWVASERLADATFPLPSTVLIRYAPLNKMEREYLTGKTNRSVYLYGLLAEAYANGVGFTNYHQKKGLPQAAGLWEYVFRAQRFILDHRDLFKPRAETGAKVAILYIENEGMRYRTDSYMGMAQALAESSIPFDVLIDGGDGFVPLTLNEEKLEPYQLVILPQALDLAPQQKATVESYVSGGGTILTADPEVFGSSREGEIARGKGKVVMLGSGGPEEGPRPKRGAWDYAAWYYHEYIDRIRAHIAKLVREHSDTVLELEGADRTVSAYPHLYPDEKRVVIHLVNSDYDAENNRMRPKQGLRIRLRRPGFYEQARLARVYSPDLPADGQGRELMPIVKDDFIELTIPALDVYDLVVL